MKALTFGEVLDDDSPSDMYYRAEDVEHLRFTLDAVKTEVTSVNPDWSRVMRLFDQVDWPSPLNGRRDETGSHK